jgi:YggT family protein
MWMGMELALTGLAEVSTWALTVYLWILIVAVLLSWVTPDPRNPLVRFLNTMTVPYTNTMARALPPRWRLFSAYAALLLLMFGIEFVPGVFSTLAAVAGGRIGPEGIPAPVAGFFLKGVAVVLQSLCTFLMFVLVIWFVLTLVNPSVHNPIVRTLYFLVDPVISPLQRILPRMRVDLSPLIAAGVLAAINWVLVERLLQFAVALTFAGVDAGLPTHRM